MVTKEDFAFIYSGFSIISFSYLIAVARTSNTMLNRGGESRPPCFIPEFSGKAFSFLLLSIMLAVDLS